MIIDANFMYGFADAIKRLRPNAKFELYNTEITHWEHELPAPSLEEIMEQYESDKSIYEKLEYARLRKQAYKEYMDPEHQLNMLWDLINSGGVIDSSSPWFISIKEIKEKYPK